MRLTPRLRIVLALVIAAVVGTVYFTWAVPVLYVLLHTVVDQTSTCESSLGGFSTCVTSFGGGVVVGVLFLVMTALGLLVGWLLAVWALRPLRDLRETIDQFGPTSLGLRVGGRPTRDEMGRLGRSVDGMLDRVAEGYEAQRRFASNASHELRTPLATQRALIEISLSSALTPEQLELLTRQLLATNERNEKLIESLLVLAEVDRGLVSHSPVALDAVAAEAVAMLSAAAGERGVELVVDAEPSAVIGERPLLERLVTNLVQNAIKYNVPDGWVRVQTSGGELVVANSGPLVPPDQVDALFEPFRRLAGERLDHGGGVGLGLTIARSIVSVHGGAIAARANPDGGLTVSVRLPHAANP